MWGNGPGRSAWPYGRLPCLRNSPQAGQDVTMLRSASRASSSGCAYGLMAMDIIALVVAVPQLQVVFM